MFNRFTDAAQQVLRYARDEAQMLGLSYIDTDAILLGLIRESNGIASRVLADSGVNIESARGAVTALLDRDEQHIGEDMSFSAATKDLLNQTLYESQKSGQNC